MYRTHFGSLLAAGSVATLACAAQASAQPRDEFQFSLPAQDLSKSLREVSLKSGRNIIAPSELVSARQAPAVSGPFTAEGVVRMLLTGSGLEVRRVGESLVIVSDHGQAPPSTEATVPTAAVRDETIIVTGTHLRGASPTSPTIVITREDIDRSGASSVEQLMRKVPQNFEGGINQENFAVTGAGADITEHGAGINLRGLGQRATLVLVNGRRLAPSGAGSFVDVSLIPLSAVERVEIVTDGASAIYGSDAVGGVVNFILRKRFDGVETSLQAGTTTEGGGDQIVAAVTAGKAWASGHAMLSYEYRHDDPIRAGDRPFTINIPPERFIFPDERRHSLFGVVAQTIEPGLDFELTGFHAERDTVRTFFIGGSNLPVNAAAHANSTGITGNASLSLGGSWLAQATGGYFVSRTHEEQDQPGGQELVNRLFTRNALMDFGLNVDGSLMRLPGGPLKLAFGAQIRREEYRDLFETKATAPAARVGNRTVRALFAEANWPLVSALNRRPGVERLVATAAARFEDYDVLGSTFDPKFGLLWSPVPGLTFRGSFDTSFRAPLLSEQTGFYNGFYFPAGLLFLDPAQAQGVSLALVGSNPAIQPERSKTWTLGAEFQPRGVPGLTVSVNYYSIRFSDRIALPTPSLIVVGNPAFDPIVTRNPSAALVGSLVGGAAQLLDLSGPGFSNGHAQPGDVTVIVDDRINNTAVTTTRGLDLSLRYRFAIGANRLDLSADANRLFTFEDQLTSASPPIETLNTPYHPIAWRARGGVAWTLGGWSANAYANFTGAYEDKRTSAVRRVGSFTMIDAGLAYTFDRGAMKDLRIALTAQNLFAERPPRLQPDPGATSGLGYDPVNATGQGRMVAVQIRKSW